MDSGGPSGSGRARARGAIGRALLDAAEEVSGIVDAAERVAGEIRAEAEAEAERYRRRREAEVDELVELRLRAVDRALNAFSERLGRIEREGETALTELEEALGRGRAGGEPAGRAVPGEFGEPAPESPVRRRSATSVSARRPEEQRSEAPAPAASERGEAPPAPAPENGDAPEERAEAAVLRAAQLAVSGHERGEIEEILRREFGITAPAGIVDEILGGR